MKVHHRSIESSKGSLMIEAALILPIVFIIVLIIIDMARLAAYRSALEESANEGLALAKVIPNLDLEDGTAPAANGALRDQAYNKVVAASERIASVGRFIANAKADSVIVPGYPTPALGKTRVEELAERPIEITVTGTFTPSLWLFPRTITVEGKAVGYREPQFYATYPKALDCAGNEILPGGPAPQNSGCACPTSNDPNAYFDPVSNKCMCSGTFVTYSPPAGGAPGACVCTQGTPSRDGAGVLSCSCDEAALRAACASSPDPAKCYVSNGSCTQQFCSYGSVANASHTSCVCPDTFCAANEYHDYYCSSCTSCAGDAAPDQSNYRCNCSDAQKTSLPAGSYLNARCDAVACGAGRITTADKRSCTCPSTACPYSGQTHDYYAGCNCTCSNGGVLMTSPVAACAPSFCKTTACIWNGSAYVKKE